MTSGQNSQSPARAALGRRAVSRALWLLWDHLFGFFALSATGGIVALLVPGLGLLMAPLVPQGWPSLGLTMATAAGTLAVLAVVWSGIRQYAVAGLHSEAGRYSDFHNGAINSAWALRCAGAVALILFLAAVNSIFYLTLAAQDGITPALRLGSSTLGMMALWLLAGVLLILWAGTTVVEDPPTGPIAAWKRGLEQVMIAPGAWLAAFITWLSFAVLFLISILGLIVVLPLAALIGTAANEVADRHRTFVIQARKELGSEASTRAIFNRAAVLWEAWEARQPRRNLRQILRPWEY